MEKAILSEDVKATAIKPNTTKDNNMKGRGNAKGRPKANKRPIRV